MPKLTGKIPPQFGGLTSLAEFNMRGLSKLTGTIPPQIGGLTSVTQLHIYSNALLSGPVPSTLTLLTNVTPGADFQLQNNPGLCLLDAGSALAAAKCGSTPVACPYPTCSCKFSALVGCPSGSAKFSTAVNPVSPFYPTDESLCCTVSGDSFREQLVTDNYLDCSVGRPCVVTPYGAQYSKKIVYNPGFSGGLVNLTSTIPPQISGMTKLSFL